MNPNLTRSDIYDINRKTGGLILGKNRLDDYVTKFLSKACKKALESPMPLPIEEILDYYNLKVEEVSLSGNLDIFGCCMLLDGNVDVYNKETKNLSKKCYSAGTILIDPDYIKLYGEGAKRNTLVHEILHWEKDKRYFEILQIEHRDKSEELAPIMCRQSETFYEPTEGSKTKENEVRWLEWQAHRLAPRVLMPRDMFKQKALEFINTLGGNRTSSSFSCDEIINSLSVFFKVSRLSVKYRLLEVGLRDKLSEFADFDSLYAEINAVKDFQELNPTDAFRLVKNDNLLRKWIIQGQFVYADGFFVLASQDYISFTEGIPHLTTKARRNKEKCIINIRETKYVEYTHFNQDYGMNAYLCHANDVDKRLYLFDPKFQGNFEKLNPDNTYFAVCEDIKGYDIEEEKELLRRLANPDTTLCDCLSFLFERRKWRYSSSFTEATDLHVNYFGDIKNNKRNNMGTDMLMAICVGLKLSLRITEKVFAKSDNKLNYYQDPDKTYIHILERFPGLSLSDFNSILTTAGLKELGTQSIK